MWTAFDPGGSATYRLLRGRFALYNELVRESADRHGAAVVDFWRMREYRDWGYWDADRMHMGPAGHQHMAIAVLDVLGVPHDLEGCRSTPATPTPACATTSTWVRELGGPVGPPAAHRPLVGRRARPAARVVRPARLASAALRM